MNARGLEGGRRPWGYGEAMSTSGVERRRAEAAEGVPRWPGRRVAFGLVMVLGLVVGGCTRPLLSPEDKRTPFDAFDAVRGQQSAQQATNEFGRSEINLRQRLAPKE